MTTYTLNKTITIEAPVEKVFAYVKDPNALWGHVRGMKVSTVVETPDVVGSTYHFRFLGFLPEVGVQTVVEVVPDKRIVLRTFPYGFNGATWTFDVQPEGAGTLLTVVYREETNPIGAALDSLTERLWGGWLMSIMAGAKSVLEAESAPSTATPEKVAAAS